MTFLVVNFRNKLLRQFVNLKLGKQKVSKFYFPNKMKRVVTKLVSKNIRKHTRSVDCLFQTTIRLQTTCKCAHCAFLQVTVEDWLCERHSPRVGLISLSTRAQLVLLELKCLFYSVSCHRLLFLVYNGTPLSQLCAGHELTCAHSLNMQVTVLTYLTQDYFILQVNVFTMSVFAM